MKVFHASKNSKKIAEKIQKDIDNFGLKAYERLSKQNNYMAKKNKSSEKEPIKKEKKMSMSH